MSQFLFVIAIALVGALWLTLAAGCFLLYRTYHLPSVPWIAGYVIVSYLSGYVIYFYFHRLAMPSTVDPHSSLALAGMSVTVIGSVGNLLAAVLGLAEVIVLGSGGATGDAGSVIRLFVHAHAYTRQLGITLLLLALALPLPSIIYYYAHR